MREKTREERRVCSLNREPGPVLVQRGDLPPLPPAYTLLYLRLLLLAPQQLP